MIAPHGGRLIDRTVTDRKQQRLLDEADEMDSVTLTGDQIKDLQNIATGRYSPLTGFMDQNNFHKVVEDKTLEDGTAWTVPITLDVADDIAEGLSPGQEIVLEDGDGTPLAVMELDELFSYDREHAVRHLYGTDDRDHPGVQMYMEKGGTALAGDIDLIQPGFDRFQDYNLRPAETRVLFKEKGWDTVVGFQTRNAPHR
ncbi:MAG: sulfate adenylyltransferase, partial [Candidatus Nanohaloarchaea archaeon]|nr:sulfate adenylyltransferase [Candidatus Nanohaloarchaea archaeon]